MKQKKKKSRVYCVYCFLNGGNYSGTPYCSRDHRWPYFNSAVRIKQKPQKMVENKNHNFILEVSFLNFTAQAIKVRCCIMFIKPQRWSKKLLKGKEPRWRMPRPRDGVKRRGLWTDGVRCASPLSSFFTLGQTRSQLTEQQGTQRRQALEQIFASGNGLWSTGWEDICGLFLPELSVCT